jgi:hypothetical protein
MLFQLVQIVYWLALSTWFGGVLFIAVEARVIFKTVRDANPMLPDVLSVNLEQQHSTLLAGSIMADLLSLLARVQLGCAGVLLPAVIAQWLLIEPNARNFVPAAVRSALYLAATGLLLYHWRIIWPAIAAARQDYIDNADTPEVANPARDRFDRCQRASITVTSLLLLLLLGMIVFSANILPKVSLGS